MTMCLVDDDDDDDNGDVLDDYTHLQYKIHANESTPQWAAWSIRENHGKYLKPERT